MSIEINTPIADVVNSTLVEIGAVDMSVVVDNSTSKAVVVIPNSYVLSSSGLYAGAMSTKGIPSWLSDAIENGVAEGNLDYVNILNDLRDALDSLELGVNQNITQIENTNLSMSSLETSIVSRLNGNDAAILHLDTTRVTAIEAQAISASAIQSTFGLDAAAYVGSIVSTYANANLATASSVDLLVAEYNGLSASITSIEEVFAGVYQEWDGIGAPMIGMFKFVGNIQYQYLGGLLGENNDGWVRTDASASTTADQAITWAAGASKLITDPSGNVTGWSFGDGTGVQSEFKVFADNFVIQGATGVIDYDNSNVDVPTKTSDLYNDNGFTTLASVAAQGYVLPAGVANAINNNATTINGSKITTGTIYAAQLNVAAIDGMSAAFNGNRVYQDGGNWCIACLNTSGGGLHAQGVNYGVVGKATSGHGVLGYTTAGGSSLGVVGQSSGTAIRGISTGGSHGFSTDTTVYAGGGYLPFTGSHIAFCQDSLVAGDIVEVVDSWVVNVDQSYVQVKSTTKANSKKVFGVVSSIASNVEDSLKTNELLTDYTGSEIYHIGLADYYEYKPEFKPYIDELVNNNYNQVKVNSLGEGAINVCDYGGNIEIGDYICSSIIIGKGMKQDDDILHNYTVAKSLEAVDWSKEASNVKMISCTYHSG